MKVTSKETYKVIRAILEMKKFTQTEISKKEKLTFSLVNKVINYCVSRGYVTRRKGYYEVTAPSAIFNLFPVYRTMKASEAINVDMPKAKVLERIKGKGILCLVSALSYYDDYYRDPTIHIYLEDEKIIRELKQLPKGYTHIEIYKEDLNSDDFVKKKGQIITSKIRTIIDLFCSNKAYAAERLIKKEWI